MGFNCRCGLLTETWTLIIGSVDIIKGILGLAASIYLCVTIIPWLLEDSDVADLKNEKGATPFIYIIAVGGTKGGMSFTLIGATLWHLCLIIFGSLLIFGIRKMSTPQLRAWYLYTLLSNIVFFGLFFRLGLTLPEMWEEKGYFSETVGIVILILFYIFTYFLPTIYCLTIVHGVVMEIYTIQRDHVPLQLQTKSMIPSSRKPSSVDLHL